MTHVALRNGPSGLQIDDQTAAGIEQWCKHFDRVTYLGITTADSATTSTNWVDVSSLACADRCDVRPLPRAYRPWAMLIALRAVTRILRDEIERHEYLCFTVGGLVGDWPALGAAIAARRGRPYAAWIDRVEPFVIRNKVRGRSAARKLVAFASILLGEAFTRRVLGRSAVALLQGLDTYEHYSRFAPDPHCTYDTHTTELDQIGVEELNAKLIRVATGAPLRLLYVGRAAAMKGPGDWIETLSAARAAGVPFLATWIGDGPELELMREQVSITGLADSVRLQGFVSDRSEVLGHMRASDVFLFCHKTPESPRSLIEALVSGAPLVGYGGAYARGLVEKGGGTFAPQDDVAALANLVEQLHRDRPSIARLIASAARSGKAYNENDVYAHRASLMKRA